MQTYFVTVQTYFVTVRTYFVTMQTYFVTTHYFGGTLDTFSQSCRIRFYLLGKVAYLIQSLYVFLMHSQIKGNKKTRTGKQIRTYTAHM